MAKNLLLEIGTEEIPAHFMPGILAQIKKAAEEKFAQLRIACENVRAVGTPRRIALMISGAAEKQADKDTKSKGPSVQAAFDAAGQPTKAAAGFARSKKVAVQDLVAKDGYVYARVHEAGLPTVELLQKALPELILNLSFPKNMRWGDLDAKFVRPVKWVAALFGEDVVPFTVFNVRSGRTTRGHRFLSRGEVSIASASDYESVMREHFVMVDPAARSEEIRRQIEELAALKGGRAEITADLLEEVTFLVEYPTALCGAFEEKYLQLPPEAVITPMREHQRYFPVKDAAGRLLPLFITVRNGGREHLDTVQHGNERVLRARLADAQFFFEEDCKVKLIDRLEKLKTVVFQEGMGSIYDKANRLVELSEFLRQTVQKGDAAVIKRAALLAKTDLVTGMVCEFTELQGIMGRAYALLNGEPKSAAEAIYEHYLPRFAGDALPQTDEGRLIGIADKIDNIIATFSRGLVPTGSQDPYALRRQALGIVNILLDAKYTLSLQTLARREMDLLRIEDEEKRNETLRNIKEFFNLRIKNVLTDEAVRYDVIDAVLSGDTDDLYGVYLKAHALDSLLRERDLTKDIQAFVRAGNLAKKTAPSPVEPALFTAREEAALYEAYKDVAQKAAAAGRDYKRVVEIFTELTKTIDVFFDKVMVMDKDEKIKNNRLALLANVTALICQVADFSKIVSA